jgi:hypothetical protein
MTAAAAPEDFEGRPVQAIEFEPQQQPYSREYLEEILPVKTGQPLRLERCPGGDRASVQPPAAMPASASMRAPRPAA